MTLSKLVLLPVFFSLAACATQPHWSPANSSRDLAVTRVSYEHDKSEQPLMSDAEAVALARNRCNAWGYSQAEMIPGELRRCSVQDGDSCDLWRVTREYHCIAGGYSQSAAR